MKASSIGSLVVAIVAFAAGLVLAFVIVAFELSPYLWPVAVFAPICGALYSRRAGKRL